MKSSGSRRKTTVCWHLQVYKVYTFTTETTDNFQVALQRFADVKSVVIGKQDRNGDCIMGPVHL